MIGWRCLTQSHAGELPLRWRVQLELYRHAQTHGHNTTLDASRLYPCECRYKLHKKCEYWNYVVSLHVGPWLPQLARTLLSTLWLSQRMYQQIVWAATSCHHSPLTPSATVSRSKHNKLTVSAQGKQLCINIQSWNCSYDVKETTIPFWRWGAHHSQSRTSGQQGTGLKCRHSWQISKFAQTTVSRTLPLPPSEAGFWEDGFHGAFHSLDLFWLPLRHPVTEKRFMPSVNWQRLLAA